MWGLFSKIKVFINYIFNMVEMMDQMPAKRLAAKTEKAWL